MFYFLLIQQGRVDVSAGQNDYLRVPNLKEIRSLVFRDAVKPFIIFTHRLFPIAVVIGFPQDVVVIGKTSPVLYGGFNNSFLYGNFQMDFFLEFRKQSDYGFKPGYGSVIENEPEYLEGRWQEPGNQTNIPAFTTNANTPTNLNVSNATFIDASYIRLKNVSLSYRLSSNFLKQLSIKSLSVFLQGQNVLTFANNKTLDPEISGNTGAVPPLKSFVAGLKITL